MNGICVCGHEDCDHDDIDNGFKVRRIPVGSWGSGKCNQCSCKKFIKPKVNIINETIELCAQVVEKVQRELRTLDGPDDFPIHYDLACISIAQKIRKLKEEK